MTKLTARQTEVLDIIRQYIEDTGYPPTRADIARELGFKSANAAEEHLKALQKKGLKFIVIVKNENSPISLEYPIAIENEHYCIYKL